MIAAATEKIVSERGGAKSASISKSLYQTFAVEITGGKGVYREW